MEDNGLDAQEMVNCMKDSQGKEANSRSVVHAGRWHCEYLPEKLLWWKFSTFQARFDWAQNDSWASFGALGRFSYAYKRISLVDHLCKNWPNKKNVMSIIFYMFKEGLKTGSVGVLNFCQGVTCLLFTFWVQHVHLNDIRKVTNKV